MVRPDGEINVIERESYWVGELSPCYFARHCFAHLIVSPLSNDTAPR